MTLYLTETVRALLAGRTVTYAILVFFDFRTTPMRVWPGFGPLRTADGHVWQGNGEIGTIEGLGRSYDGQAEQTTFTMSGVDPSLLGRVNNEREEVEGRDVTVFLQFYDEDSVLLDAPYADYFGVMDQMSYTVGGGTATIKVTAEWIFAQQDLPPPLYQLSDRTQQILFPGDLGMQRYSSINFKRAIWPIITPP